MAPQTRADRANKCGNLSPFVSLETIAPPSRMQLKAGRNQRPKRGKAAQARPPSPPKMLTEARKQKIKQFVVLSRNDPEKYGMFESSRWLEAGLKFIKGRGVKLTITDLRNWIHNFPEIFEVDSDEPKVAATGSVPISIEIDGPSSPTSSIDTEYVSASSNEPSDEETSAESYTTQETPSDWSHLAGNAPSSSTSSSSINLVRMNRESTLPTDANPSSSDVGLSTGQDSDMEITLLKTEEAEAAGENVLQVQNPQGTGTMPEDVGPPNQPNTGGTTTDGGIPMSNVVHQPNDLRQGLLMFSPLPRTPGGDLNLNSLRSGTSTPDLFASLVSPLADEYLAQIFPAQNAPVAATSVHYLQQQQQQTRRWTPEDLDFFSTLVRPISRQSGGGFYSAAAPQPPPQGNPILPQFVPPQQNMEQAPAAAVVTLRQQSEEMMNTVNRIRAELPSNAANFALAEHAERAAQLLDYFAKSL